MWTSDIVIIINFKYIYINFYKFAVPSNIYEFLKVYT
jgi:hypothetical protein